MFLEKAGVSEDFSVPELDNTILVGRVVKEQTSIWSKTISGQSNLGQSIFGHLCISPQFGPKPFWDNPFRQSGVCHGGAPQGGAPKDWASKCGAQKGGAPKGGASKGTDLP